MIKVCLDRHCPWRGNARTRLHVDCLHQMAAAAGYDRDIGRVVDKIVRAWLAKKEER